VLKVFVGLRAVGAQGGVVRQPGGVGGQVTLLGRYLEDAASYECAEAHKEVQGEGEGEAVVLGGEREAFQLAGQEGCAGGYL